MRQVTVRVPASTSNLGPGFDCLGVALNIHNFVTVRREENRLMPPIARQAARLFFSDTGLAPFSFKVSMRENVPRSRGLGSSATVRLGVLHALNYLARRPLDDEAIFRLCAKLERHPDNAAPSNFGGFTVVTGPTLQRFDVSKRLSFVLLIPDLEIETARARTILPDRINRRRAVESCANACAITAAFVSRDYQTLRGAIQDHLHQPFRQKLIPFLGPVMAAAEKAGALGAFLSGSGSTIAAVTLTNPRKIAQAMLRASKLKSARTLITRADNKGAEVVKIRNPHSAI